MSKLDRRLLWIAALALLGGILMWLGGRSAEPQREPVPADWQQYTQALEEKATALCARVTGVGEVTVAISLAQGVEYVYADEAARETVLLTERPPQLSGIGVVCRGGDDPAVAADLIALLSAAFGIGTNRIYVTAGN